MFNHFYGQFAQLLKDKSHVYLPDLDCRTQKTQEKTLRCSVFRSTGNTESNFINPQQNSTGEHVRAAAAAKVRDGAPRPDHGQHRRQDAGEAAPAAHGTRARAVWADHDGGGRDGSGGRGGAGEGDGAAGAEVDRVQVGDRRQGVPAAAQPRDPAGARAQEEQGLQRPVRAQILRDQAPHSKKPHTAPEKRIHRSPLLEFLFCYKTKKTHVTTKKTSHATLISAVESEIARARNS